MEFCQSLRLNRQAGTAFRVAASLPRAVSGLRLARRSDAALLQTALRLPNLFLRVLEGDQNGFHVGSDVKRT